MFCDEIQDMDLTTALQKLLALFTNVAGIVSAEITKILKCKVTEWLTAQPAFIQALFQDSCLES